MGRPIWGPVAGAVVAAVAVAPPLDARADANLVWHMVQHLALLTISGPLLAAGLPHGGRRHPLAVEVGAALTGTFVITAWHVPFLFDAATANVPIHVAEHVSFVVASAALWSLAGSSRIAPLPQAVPVIFLVSLVGTGLGATMALSGVPWYRGYPDLTDQQVAGALMWSVSGAATVACGLVALVRHLRNAPEST